jgi:hypothetical protein
MVTSPLVYLCVETGMEIKCRINLRIVCDDA